MRVHAWRSASLLCALVWCAALTAHGSMDRPKHMILSVPLNAQPEDPIEASDGAYTFGLPLLDLGGPMDLAFALILRIRRTRLRQASAGRQARRGAFHPPLTHCAEAIFALD